MLGIWKYRLSDGNSTHKNIKHLVIDEMQDYSYLQHNFEMLFHCRMTLLETAQTLDTKQQDVLRFLPNGRVRSETIEIKKSEWNIRNCLVCESQ